MSRVYVITDAIYSYSRFTSVDYSHVWLLIGGCINQLCGETQTDLRMGVPAPKNNFAGVSVTLTKTQRKAAINFEFQSGCESRELEEWLEAQPQRFAILGITDDSYDAVVWVTSHNFLDP
jgi:hypothetical protein